MYEEIQLDQFSCTNQAACVVILYAFDLTILYALDVIIHYTKSILNVQPVVLACACNSSRENKQ